MFKRAENSCSLERVRGFAPYGWTNVRQLHLTCVGFAEGGTIRPTISSSNHDLRFREFVTLLSPTLIFKSRLPHSSLSHFDVAINYYML